MSSRSLPRRARFPLLALTALLAFGVHSLARDFLNQSGDPGKTPPGIDYARRVAIADPELGGEGSLRFALFGDWGMPTHVHRLVSQGVNAFQRDLERSGKGLDAVLLAGDNFYPIGIGSLTDARWELLWGKPFRSVKVPFYVALGNHDYGAGAKYAQLQVEKSGTKGYENWICRDANGPDEPGIFYDHWFSSDKIAVQLVVIDTSMLLVGRLGLRDRWGAHLQWLSDRLDAAPPKAHRKKKVARLVIGHHVPLCFGEKENEVRYINSEQNKVGPGGRSLTELLAAKADAYLAGHAHTVQYINLSGKKVAPGRGPIHGRTRVLDQKEPLELISGTAGQVRKTSYWAESCYYTARLPGFTNVVIDDRDGALTLTANFVDCSRESQPRIIYALRMPLEGGAPRRSY